MTARAQERAAGWHRGVFMTGDSPKPQKATQRPSTEDFDIGTLSAWWSAHLDTPVSADDVRVMLAMVERVKGAQK
jgi:hypothetical protein